MVNQVVLGEKYLAINKQKTMFRCKLLLLRSWKKKNFLIYCEESRSIWLLWAFGCVDTNSVCKIIKSHWLSTDSAVKFLRVISGILSFVIRKTCSSKKFEIIQRLESTKYPKYSAWDLNPWRRIWNSKTVLDFLVSWGEVWRKKQSCRYNY